MNVELLDKAVAGALCPTFQALVAGSSFVQVLGPLAGPKGMAAALTAVPVTSLSMMGAAATCGEVEIGPDPAIGLEGGCTKTDGASNLNATKTDGSNSSITIATNAVQIISIDIEVDSFGYNNYLVHYKDVDGRIRFGYGIRGEFGGPPAPQRIELIPKNGASCLEDAPVFPPFENPTVPDHTYVDESTNCTYNVKFQGLIRESDNGPVMPAYQISGGSTRASGGRMGGCNFEPVIYTPGPTGPGGPGGPPIPPIPVPPGPLPDPIDGVPWWAAPLLSGATSAALNLIGQELAKLTEPVYEAGSFTLTAPCDYTEEGDNVQYFFNFPTAKFQQRVIDHQMAILETLQYHLNSKTPICHGNDRIEGDWRTISFVSENTSPFGKSRLRKRFRYRSVSGWTDDQLVDHWKDFVWQSGPIIVKHLGASWGTPQCWAATADEGKRLIRHAAGEAGIDPDQVGRWQISGSHNPRYGVSDTMRVETRGGYYWITARDGSDNRPQVKTTPDP